MTAHSLDPATGKPHYHAEECAFIPNSYATALCLAPYFQRLTRQDSATAALARAEELLARNVIDDCHLIAHFVGEENLRKHDYDIGRALGTCPTSCIQGCVHGAMQTYVSERVEWESLVATLRPVCDGLDDPWMRRQCIHGIGHGFLTGGYLPLADAVRACRYFQTGEDAACVGGVFMEHVQPYLDVPPDELTSSLGEICRDAEAIDGGTHLEVCAYNVGAGLMFYTANDAERSRRLCRELPADQVDACAMAVEDTAAYLAQVYGP